MVIITFLFIVFFLQLACPDNTYGARTNTMDSCAPSDDEDAVVAKLNLFNVALYPKSNGFVCYHFVNVWQMMIIFIDKDKNW